MSGLLRRFHRDQRGTWPVEYMVVMAVVVLGLSATLAPYANNPIYQSIRNGYRRAVVMISVPWL